MSSQRDTFEPANVPRPENLGERRGYINQYIQRFHSDLVPQIEEKRKEALLSMCTVHHDRGMIDVPAVYFEYTIDKTLWRDIFLHLGEQAPAWPWNEGPKEHDMNSGMSTAYREWRIEKGFPVMPSQADRQWAGNLELQLSQAQREIEQLKMHLQDAKTLQQELKEALQGRLDDKDALLRSKDQEIQRLRVDGSDSGSRQRRSLDRHTNMRLSQQLAITETTVTAQRQELKTANSRITHLENLLTDNPSKVQALETELAEANTRASNAEDNNRHLERQLRDANTRLAGGHEPEPSIRIPEGPLGELAGMYAVLAREVTDLPILPQRFACFDLQTTAAEVAPLLFRLDAMGNLRRFLAAGSSHYHCLENVVDGISKPTYDCRDHKGDCVYVRVANTAHGNVLDFSGSEE
ncbi:hypothetical protein J7337_009268 [Fusarium musae]|uniref:Uncharacterized protein n=1 Tax=Fusarium musae TaxID=1042133 RepID=A0A9P8DAU5_9HYPO|nr:hypothetical protein J7337_009268 [Fusarium musae]KAG9498463.1 hypothetical protein J7337_009268 [Fusarium musae]